MKTYYVQTSVSYLDSVNNNTIEEEEFFDFIISAENKPNASKDAIRKSLDIFNEDFNVGFENISCQVESIYETSSDARTS